MASTRPAASLNKADWKRSKAKQLVAQDIMDGEIPMEGPFDPEEVFQRLYTGHEYFKDFPFDRIRYKDRIERLRKSIKQLQYWATYDSAKVDEDLALHPPSAQNIRGDLRWNGSDAQQQLKDDITRGLHLQMKPKELRNTRPEYMLFGTRAFQKHVDQEKQSRKDFDEATKAKRYSRSRYGDRENAKRRQQEDHGGNKSSH